MKTAIEVELLSLVEKLELSDLKKAAALIFREWCLDRGTSPESALEFFVSMIEMQPNQVSKDLEVLATTLRQIR